jgi:hypothetical protein
MRKGSVVLLTLLVVGGVVVFFVHRDRERVRLHSQESLTSAASTTTTNLPTAIPPSAVVPVEVRTALPGSESNVVTTRASSDVPSREPEMADPPPATVLENMRGAIRLYGSTFGGNPVGTNPEITSALNGGNPRHVKFVREESGLRINAGGELVDSWGTPFFFHQLSGKQMEIHSAGPDRVMWTADDLVIR